MAPGKVFLVGAGPGDPKLLTIKAAELLKTAEIVIYDRLVSEAILRLIPETAEKIYVGKKSGKHIVPQEKITDLLIEKALTGKNVVRLKGGDPFVFGRGGEEAETLAEKKVPFEVVPGISSAFAAPLYAGIPVTHRDYASSVAIVTGHQAGEGERSVNWAKLAGSVDTVVILMGLESLESIVKKLLDGGLNPATPVAVIEQGTSQQQRTLAGTLTTISKIVEAADLHSPAVIVVGNVVNLGRKLSWFNPHSH
jgi:uroporphyrin-III C-methyltransferase